MEHNVDFHTAFAAKAFRVPQEAVTRLQRETVKLYTFGALYGAEQDGLTPAHTGRKIIMDKNYQLLLSGFEKLFSTKTKSGPGIWGVWLPFMSRYF